MRLAAAALAFACAAASTAEGRLVIATWNLEWMMTPEAFDVVATSCFGRDVRPSGDARAIPCDLVARGRYPHQGLLRQWSAEDERVVRESMAATGVGAGDLATGAFTGSALGTAVLWAVLAGAALKYALNEGLARWQLVTGETLLEAAHRELREEIGYDAAQLNQINTYYPSKSVMHEIAHLYVGNQLTRIQVIPDETEFLEIEIFPFGQVLQMVLQSEIRDGMTVLAVLYAARLLGT